MVGGDSRRWAGLGVVVILVIGLGGAARADEVAHPAHIHAGTCE